MFSYAGGSLTFIMIGGDAEANLGGLNYGDWITWAKDNGTEMCLPEQHHYGESRPTKDMTVEKMVYLNSKQELKDLGHVINNPHLRFSHLGAGSVLSSDPLFAKLDYFEYLTVIADILDTVGAGCNTKMTETLTGVENLVGDGNGWEELGSMFPLCGPIDGTNALDVKLLMELLQLTIHGKKESYQLVK